MSAQFTQELRNHRQVHTPTQQGMTLQQANVAKQIIADRTDTTCNMRFMATTGGLVLLCTDWYGVNHVLSSHNAVLEYVTTNS